MPTSDRWEYVKLLNEQLQRERDELESARGGGA